MLHQTLWKKNQDLAEACLQHPFIQHLGKGTLDQEVFKQYLAQDAFFLHAYIRAYALCAAKANTLEHTKIFHILMTGAIDELKVHHEFSRELGIDLKQVQPYPETLAYTDFLLRNAWHESISVTVAAMVPCMCLYAWLGTSLKPNLTDHHPFERWILAYSSKGFFELAEELEEILDSLAKDTPEIQNTYRYAMQCELDFFNAPMR